jgi:hypothetical protein
MMQYKFKFRRLGSLISHTIVVEAHKYEPAMDKMILFLKDGTMREIACWSRCEVVLGPDYIVAQKDAMSKSTGTNVV